MSLKDITLGHYIFGTSLLHRLDPRTKLLSICIVMVGLFTGSGWTAPIIAAAFTCAAWVVSGFSFSSIVRSLLPFKWLILMTVVLNILFVGGHIIFEAPLPYGGITREGLEFGLLYGVRITLLIVSASLLTMSTEIDPSARLWATSVAAALTFALHLPV